MEVNEASKAESHEWLESLTPENAACIRRLIATPAAPSFSHVPTRKQAAVAAVANPRVRYLDTTGFFNAANSGDGIHPLGVEHIAHIAPALAAALAPLIAQATPLSAWSYA